MKEMIKRLLGATGWRLKREPRNKIAGLDLWRDLGILVAPEPVCIDAGANRGDVTQAFLRLRPSAHVHLFEPSPRMFALLQKRFAGDTRTHLVNAALGDASGSLDFHVYANDHLSSCLPLSSQAANPYRDAKALQILHVPVTTVNDYCESNGLRQVDLLKIDTQGFDLAVLRGSEGLFVTRSVAAVMVELNFDTLYDGQAHACDVMRHLLDRDFALVDFYEKANGANRIAWCTAVFTRR